MRTLLLIFSCVLATACQVKREEVSSPVANYSNDYVLIEFASKLEEEQLQQTPTKD